MTWGQIRLNLLTTSPGIPLDLLDEWINARYGTVLQATDWIGLKGHSLIQTTAAYQSGADTVSAIVGQIAIVGVGTMFTQTALPGLKFYIPGDSVTYTLEVMSDTLIALDRPYEGKPGDLAGTASAGSPYVLMQNIYALPADCRSIVTVLDPRSGLPLHPFTKDGLDASAGIRTRVGYPQAWAEYDDSPESAPPVLHQIEFFPPPLVAQGFPLEYLRAASGFDGQNLTASPLPFIGQQPTVILAGVRADVAVFQDKFQKAIAYEKQFEDELTRLLLVEHSQRRVKTAVKMASRFTRHRLVRAARGMRGGPGMPNPPINQP